VDRRRVLLAIVAVIALVAIGYGIAYQQLINTEGKNCPVIMYGQQPAPGCG
jgi:hypothetical protein